MRARLSKLKQPKKHQKRIDIQNAEFTKKWPKR